MAARACPDGGARPYRQGSPFSPLFPRPDGAPAIPPGWCGKEKPMETSKHIDRERRRTKPKMRKSWAKVLLNPKTVKSLVWMGKLLARVVWLCYVITKILRE